MRCFFRVREAGAVWVEGYISSHHGGRDIDFVSKSDGKSICLSNPEVLFQLLWVSVTGYKHKGDDNFELTGVDVVFHKAQIPKD